MFPVNRRLRFIVISVAVAGLALVFAAAGFGFASLLNPGKTYFGSNQTLNSVPAQMVADMATAVPVADNPAMSTADRNILQAFQNASRSIASQVLPVVVRIDIEKNVKIQRGNPFQFFFNGQPFGGDGDPKPGDNNNDGPTQKQGGFGSGIIIEQKGDTVFVLTNNHVVDGADKYIVRTHDNKSFDAKVVGADKNRDLAVISFQSKDKLAVARLGDSNQVHAGDIAYAVGSPYGIQNTITQGIISAVGRTASDLPGGGGDTASGFTDYLQTDTAINPGNSGGALVNFNGEVIGINTWIATRTGENVGLGFAVPINNAKKVVVDFLTKGHVEYGWLGIKTGEIIDQTRTDLKLGRDQKGAFAYSVIKGSPAEKSGLLPGDVLTNVNGVTINSANDLIRTVSSLDVNTEVKVQLIRNGAALNLNVKLGLRDDKADMSSWPGFSVIPMSDDIRKEMQNQANGVKPKTKPADVPNGSLVVVAVEDPSNATEAGLKQGDVVTAVSGQAVKSVAEFYAALGKSGKDIQLKILRNAKEVSLSFQK